MAWMPKVHQEIANCLERMQQARDSGNNDLRYAQKEKLSFIEDNYLPRGSGFDSGTEIMHRKWTGKIFMRFAFHHMDQNGYYCGWSYHNVIVSPTLQRDFDLRVTTVKGSVGMRYGDADYLFDTIHFALSQEIKEEDMLKILEIGRRYAAKESRE